MRAGTLTGRRALLRWLVMPAVLISLEAALGPVVPAPQAVADVAQVATSRAASAGPGIPVTVYVANGGSDTVTPIQTATNTAGPPIPAGSQPFAIAITPDGKTAYVVNSLSGTVTPIDTATNTAGAPITVGNGPEPIVITPNGKTVYVASLTSDTVTPIDTATNTAGAPIPAGGQPSAIAITPDGKTVYVANIFGGTVTPIDTATNTAGASIPVGSNPDNLAITPDGKTVYVANANYGCLLSHCPGTVTPIDTATNTAGVPITVGTYPGAVAITPDGKTAYVANTDAGTVISIATATNTVGEPIPVGSEPYAIAITPDGKTAYVVNPRSGTVTPIDTATNTAAAPITVGNRPDAIAITPTTITQGPAFTSGAAATAPFGVAFTSTVTTTGSPPPTITRTGRLPSGVRFTDNKDGTATISGTPRRAAAGVYPLTLTARNKNGTATQAFTLAVTRAPAIRRIRPVRVRVGAGLRLTVRATGYPAPALAESGLPGGLTFTDNGNGTAVIRGSPAPGSDGRYLATITATNTEGIATRHFRIIVSRRRRQ